MSRRGGSSGGPFRALAGVLGFAAYLTKPRSHSLIRRSRTKVTVSRPTGKPGWHGPSRFFRQGRAGLFPILRAIRNPFASMRTMYSSHQAVPMPTSRAMQARVSTGYGTHRREKGSNYELRKLHAAYPKYSGYQLRTMARALNLPSFDARTTAPKFYYKHSKVIDRYRRVFGDNPPVTVPGASSAMSPSSMSFTYGSSLRSSKSMFGPQKMRKKLTTHISAEITKKVAQRVARQPVFSKQAVRHRQAAKTKVRQTGPVKVKEYTRHGKGGKSVRVHSFSRKRRQRR